MIKNPSQWVLGLIDTDAHHDRKCKANSSTKANQLVAQNGMRGMTQKQGRTTWEKEDTWLMQTKEFFRQLKVREDKSKRGETAEKKIAEEISEGEFQPLEFWRELCSILSFC